VTVRRPAIVCLHGHGRGAADWDPSRAALAALGEVTAPELRSQPQAALEQLDRVIAPGAIVIGHSMGAVTLMRLLSRRPRPLRAVVLTGCFFRPARNGRSLTASLRDYGVHRVAYLRGARFERAERASRGAVAPLASLLGAALRPGDLEPALDRAAGRVLIVHARDDHHVPVDFAVAAARRHPDWALEVLADGGHHAHVRTPAAWAAVVVPWLDGA
jgi:pimeloyl-ACP methyl ester carboxylesterase